MLNKKTICIIGISILLFTVICIFYPDTFSNYIEDFANKLQIKKEKTVLVKKEKQKESKESKESKEKESKETKNIIDQTKDYQNLVNEAKEIKKKLDSEDPKVSIILESAQIPIVSSLENINNNNNNAPKWWYPLHEYDPEKFKEQIEFKNFVPAYDYLGNCQDMYWDFKQQLK